MESAILETVKCFHCGQPCDEVIIVDDKAFCCVGCQSVFEILQDNNLCAYYRDDAPSGVSQHAVSTQVFDYLDEPGVRKKLLTFESDTLSKVTFQIPAIHCVSCIWLLENLRKLNPAIVKAEVTFGKKTLDIAFNPGKTKLSAVATLLASLGYPPSINLEAAEETKTAPNHTLLIKLVIAGFSFGNIMLFSFPEYLGLDSSDPFLIRLFSWLNLALSIPVFLFSASEYFTSAWASFRQKQINIDVPIAAGLVALFARSGYDILSASGPGYLDSFAGLVFFLLIGRWFQSKTYESLSFDRDFKSYFPLAIHRLENDVWNPVVIYELKRGDQIQLRNLEIVPADSVLLSSQAYFDFSFVTGEAKPVKVMQGETVYAGGRLVGKPVELVVDRKTSQSHLTSLWNNYTSTKVLKNGYQKMIDKAARYFTWIVLGLAMLTAGYWYVHQPDRMWLVLTSVLMVACPCALALAAPFTYGSMLRVFGKNDLYVKNADVIERLAAIDAVVFDKTGTVTYGSVPDIEFIGDLSSTDLAKIKLLSAASTHPLSSVVTKFIRTKGEGEMTAFKEIPGKGVQAIIEGNLIQVGSAAFVGFQEKIDPNASLVFVAINGDVRGYFTVRIKMREHIQDMLNRLGRKCVALLSGDNEADRSRMAQFFHSSVQLLFNQTPYDKLDFMKHLQRQGKHVMMVGDGLNDSGALLQSDVGIAVTDDTGVFTPACDGILKGNRLPDLDRFIDLAKASSRILKIGFVISFFYNAIALTVAISGNLTPLIAAILMPVSSISVVGFSTLAVNMVARLKFKS